MTHAVAPGTPALPRPTPSLTSTRKGPGTTPFTTFAPPTTGGPPQMKKIMDSRKLLGATAKTDLKELALLYKALMKAHHPDRFQEEARRQEAEETSKHIIEAYRFLVSIAPETHEQNAEQYERTTSTSAITDFHYKSQTLNITFADGSVYDYFGVPVNVYNKFVNNDANLRFARRHICTSYTRRMVKKPGEPAA